MNDGLQGIRADDDTAVAAADIPTAVTAGRLVYVDGATQVFTIDGKTTYSERNGDSAGEWYVEPAILGATSRRRITLDQAAALAAHPAAEWRPGQPGGTDFDTQVTARLAEREQVAS